MTRPPPGRPVAVCALERLLPERGAAVLLGGHQIALFRVEVDGETRVFAVSHRDPVSGAHVMARGILGSSGDRVTVASPMYKQVYDLATGEGLTDPQVRLPIWRTVVEEGLVHVEPDPVPSGVEPVRVGGPDPVDPADPVRMVGVGEVGG